MEELPTTTDESQAPGKTHVVILVNGLFGSSANWEVVRDHLARFIDAQATLLVASEVNRLLQTFDGIDSCGERLAEEVRVLVAQHSTLQRISVIGHSMGGLVARYALGKLYDPATGCICGLKPCHFITLASPHLGCDGDGPAQVPLIGWSGEVPLAGTGLQKVLQTAARPFASLVLRRTGEQFFLLDRDDGREPLLLRMTRDSPEDGFFFSALDSFITRTCYANSSGDHLVGWANASLRHPDQLPALLTRGRGVVREDALEAALWPDDLRGLDSTPPAGEAHGPEVEGKRKESQEGSSSSVYIASPAEGRGGKTHSLQGAKGQWQSDGSAAQEPSVDGQPVKRQHIGSSIGERLTRLPGDEDEKEQGSLGQAKPSHTAQQHSGEVHGAGSFASPETTAGRAGEPVHLEGQSDQPGSQQPNRDHDGQTLQTQDDRHNDEPSSGGDMPGKSSSSPEDGRAQGPQQQSTSQDPNSMLVLERLQRLPWRRIDVCFQDTRMPFFSHNMIQVTRRWLNWEGEAVAEHLAAQFAALEKHPAVQAKLQSQRLDHQQ